VDAVAGKTIGSSVVADGQAGGPQRAGSEAQEQEKRMRLVGPHRVVFCKFTSGSLENR
jgi:hypothetical protein